MSADVPCTVSPIDDRENLPPTLEPADSQAAITPSVSPLSPADGPATPLTRLGSFQTRDPSTLDMPAPTGPIDIPGYEILGELGRGGMGVVYKARHLALKRTVALKMVLDGAHAGAAALSRFRAEAEAVAKLQHPNIVQVHEVGECGGRPFFSLEFVEGGSLDRKLAGTPLPPREAAEVVEKLAETMHAVHQQGIVHRDLKPANVLLTANGTPKITDFGLAKNLKGESGQTASGAVMGTPSYMAPEQASGKTKEIGPLSDVYALGVILYELLVGRPPFRGATAMETLLQVMEDEPVPPSRLAKVPADLETICLKALHKKAAQRYGSAEALAEDLRRFRTGEPIAARPASRLERTVKWAKRRPALAALLAMSVAAVLILTVLGAWFTWKLDLSRRVAEDKERAALKEADKAKKAQDFLVSIFDLSDVNGRRGTMTARQILDDAEKRIPIEFVDQPELQAELMAAIETVYAKMTVNAPLAMILEVSGTVQLQSTRDPKQRAVLQTLLYAGDRLTLAADGKVQLVYLSDLHKERIKPDQDVIVRRKSSEPKDAVGERSDDPMMTFVKLPKGTFYMGWDGPNKPGKMEEIKREFYIAAHAVTQGQWQAVMGENPSHFSRFGGGRHDVKNISDEELKLFPVESVSWFDAQDFIKKLNEQEKKRGSKYIYRLPTAAEWEYACRGGALSEEECSFHFYFEKPTNEMSSKQANFYFDPYDLAPKGKKMMNRTTMVNEHLPNQIGLYDMHGNVKQWCYDLSNSVSEANRVLRGGSWCHIHSECTAAYSEGWVPSYRRNFWGFRVARDPIP